MIKIIAAVGKELELGKSGNLIWYLPNDLKFFKEQTSGSTVLMGCNTFNSLPFKLPNRKHIVLAMETDAFNKDISDVEIVNNFEEAVIKCEQASQKGETIFIIGGASVYSQFLEFADELILTEVDATCKEADVYFPAFDKTKYVRKVISSNSDNNIHYEHVVYTKI